MPLIFSGMSMDKIYITFYHAYISFISFLVLSLFYVEDNLSVTAQYK